VARIIRHALARSEKKENELEKEAQERSGQRHSATSAGSIFYIEGITRRGQKGLYKGDTKGEDYQIY
jgi:hypothetical protein